MCLSVNCNVVKVHGLGRYTRLFSDSVASPECRAGMCCSATASVDTTALTPGGSLSHIQAATTENALQENAEPNIGGGLKMQNQKTRTGKRRTKVIVKTTLTCALQLQFA